MQVARSEGHGAGQPASAEPEPIGTAVGIVGIQLPFWEVALLVLQVTICQALLAGVALLVLRYLDVI
jgi:hypothetical protein